MITFDDVPRLHLMIRFDDVLRLHLMMMITFDDVLRLRWWWWLHLMMCQYYIWWSSLLVLHCPADERWVGNRDQKTIMVSLQGVLWQLYVCSIRAQCQNYTWSQAQHKLQVETIHCLNILIIILYAAQVCDEHNWLRAKLCRWSNALLRLEQEFVTCSGCWW